MECFKCGASVLEENAAFCHECGARLDGKIACARCGQFIDNSYAYCTFCGAKVGQTTTTPDWVMQQNQPPFPNGNGTFTQQGGQSFAGENGKLENKILVWTRAWLGMALALISLAFVFLIGFQINLSGQAVAFSEINFETTQENVKFFYYFSDVYKEIETLKELFGFQSNYTITAAYTHAVMGTVISAVTIGCVIGFAATAIVNFIMLFIKKAETNSAKWAVRAVIAYIAGCIALRILNYCLVDINLISSERPSWKSPLTATISIDFDVITNIGLILCMVGVALYAILSCIKQILSGITKKKLLKFAFGVLAAAFAIVVFAVGQNAIVGTAITTSDGLEQNMTLSLRMAQLSFASFLYSSFQSQYFPIVDPSSKIDTALTFAVVQEIMLIGIVVCSLCAIASRIFETDGKAKGAVPFALLTTAFSIVQLIAGIVSNSVVHDLYNSLFGSNTATLTTNLILQNSIISLVFALLLLVTSFISLKITKPKKTPSSPQD